MKNIKKSLTFVELLISVAIVTVIFYVVLQVYVTNQRFVHQNQNEISARTSVRQVYWRIKHDLREAYSNIATSTTTLDSVGDSFVVTVPGPPSNPDVNITYAFSDTSQNGFVLTRTEDSGPAMPIATDVIALSLNNTSNGIELEVESLGDSFYGRSHTVLLKQLINKRN